MSPVSWKKQNLDKLVPSEVKDLASEAAGLVSAVAEILDTAATIIDTLSAFIIAFSDPVIAIIQSFVDAVTDFIGDLRTAGAYLLPVVPSYREPNGLQQFLDKVVLSFDDIVDTDRPVFSSGANVAGVVIVAGAPNLADLFTTFLEKFGALVDITEFKKLKWQTDPEKDEPPPVLARTCYGRKPDWSKKTVGNVFPGLDNALKNLENMVTKLFPGQQISDFIDAMVEAINNKVDDLQDTADALEDIATALDSLFDISDVYTLYSGVVGGVDGFKTALNESINRPGFDDTYYVAGAVFLAGGPGVSEFERIFGVLA